MGSREGVASKIDADTDIKLQEMNRALNSNKENVIGAILDYIYDIHADLHPNYRAE